MDCVAADLLELASDTYGEDYSLYPLAWVRSGYQVLDGMLLIPGQPIIEYWSFCDRSLCWWDSLNDTWRVLSFAAGEVGWTATETYLIDSFRELAVRYPGRWAVAGPAVKGP